MKSLKQGAAPVTKDSAKPIDIAKAAEGVWAALLQGSAMGKIEHLAVPAVLSVH
ncbi:MAG TPA: hypothetical protein VIJ49_04645 [Aestuariivirga sp.]